MKFSNKLHCLSATNTHLFVSLSRLSEWLFSIFFLPFNFGVFDAVFFAPWQEKLSELQTQTEQPRCWIKDGKVGGRQDDLRHAQIWDDRAGTWLAVSLIKGRRGGFPLGGNRSTEQYSAFPSKSDDVELGRLRRRRKQSANLWGFVEITGDCCTEKECG